MFSRWNGRDAIELGRLRRLLIQRAALERWALRDTTEDLQDTGDRIVHVGAVAVGVVRKYWLPIGALVGLALFKRAGSALRLARIGLTIWQASRLLRAARP